MSQANLWRPGDKLEPREPQGNVALPPEVWKTIKESVDGMDKELRELSLDISGTCHDVFMLTSLNVIFV